MSNHVPPHLKLTDWLEMGHQPEFLEPGTGAFLCTSVAGTLLIAGYLGDEVVTLVCPQHRTPDGQYLNSGIMIRVNLGQPPQFHKFVTTSHKAAETRINAQLQVWYSERDDLSPHHLDCNPLKQV